MGELSVLSRQVEDALERGQFAVDPRPLDALSMRPRPVAAGEWRPLRSSNGAELFVFHRTANESAGVLGQVG